MPVSPGAKLQKATILLENPVAVVSKSSHKVQANAFVNFLHTPAAQKIFADSGYRPVLKSVAKSYHFVRPPGLFTISSAKLGLNGLTRVNRRFFDPNNAYLVVVGDVTHEQVMAGANKAFTGLVTLSLALGIGANTAVYSFMDSILLRELPVPKPGSLALLNWHSKEPRGIRPNHVMHGSDGSTWGDAKTGKTSGIFPFGAFELLEQDNSVFSSLFAYCPSDKRSLTIHGQAEISAGEYDHFPEQAFFMCGGLEDLERQARELMKES